MALILPAAYSNENRLTTMKHQSRTGIGLIDKVAYLVGFIEQVITFQPKAKKKGECNAYPQGN